jgi:hypothetical protein
MKFSLVRRRPGGQGVQVQVDYQQISRQAISKTNAETGCSLVAAAIPRRAR